MAEGRARGLAWLGSSTHTRQDPANAELRERNTSMGVSNNDRGRFASKFDKYTGFKPVEPVSKSVRAIQIRKKQLETLKPLGRKILQTAQGGQTELNSKNKQDGNNNAGKSFAEKDKGFPKIDRRATFTDMTSLRSQASNNVTLSQAYRDQSSEIQGLYGEISILKSEVTIIKRELAASQIQVANQKELLSKNKEILNERMVSNAELKSKEALIEAAGAESRKLERHVEQLNRELEQAKQQCKLSKQQLESKVTRAAELETLCNHEKSQSEQLRDKLGLAEHQLRLVRQKLAEREEEERSQQGKKQGKKVLNANGERELKRKQEQIGALEESLINTKAALQAAEEASITIEKSKETEISALRRDLARKETEISRHLQALKRANTTNEMEVKSLKADLAQSRKKQQAMEADVARLHNDQKSIDIIKNARDQHKQRSQKLEKELAELSKASSARQKELEDRVAAARLEVTTTDVAFAKLSKELADANAARDSAQESVKASKVEATRLAGQLASAKIAVEQASRMNAQSHEEMQKVAASHAKLKSSLTLHEQQKKKLEAALSKAEQSLSNEVGIRFSAQSKSDELGRKCDQLGGENAKLLEQLDSATRERTSQDQQLKKVQAELEKLLGQQKVAEQAQKLFQEQLTQSEHALKNAQQALKSEQTRHGQEKKELTESLATVNEKLRRAHQDDAEQERKQRSEAQSAQVRITTLSVEKDQLKKKVESLQARLDEVHETVTNELKDGHAKAIAELRAEKDTESIRWQGKASQLARALEEKTLQVEQAIGKANEREKELELFRLTLNTATSDVNALQDTVKGLQQQARHVENVNAMLTSIKEEVMAQKAILNLKLLLKAADTTDATTYLEFARLKEKSLEQQLQVLVYNITACETHMAACDPTATTKQRSTRKKRLEKIEQDLKSAESDRNDYLKSSKTNRMRLAELLSDAEKKLQRSQAQTQTIIESELPEYNWSL